jgi:hypothetical protein
VNWLVGVLGVSVIFFAVGWFRCQRDCRRRVRAMRADYNDRLSTLYNEVKRLRSSGPSTR